MLTTTNGSTKVHYRQLRAEAEDLVSVLGRPVVPLAETGVPLVRWGDFVERDTPPSLREMRSWPWAQATGAAIVLGPSRRLGGHLWCIDAEAPGRGAVEFELDRERPGWRQSVVTETQRRGLHVYSVGDGPITPARFLHGDVLGTGKLAVVPPTPPFKPDATAPYSWLSVNVDDVLTAAPTDILPRWWLEAPVPAPAHGATPRPARRPVTALGQCLATLLRRPDVLRRVLSVLGLPRDLSPDGSRAVLCLFCSERRPSMSLWTAPNGEPVLRVWHRCDGSGGLEFVPLPTAYAALQRGHCEPLSGAAYAAWKLRLLADAGALPPLPAPHSDDATAVYVVLVWLSGVSRDLAGEPAVPASRDFLATLLTWPERRARDAFSVLLRSGRLERCRHAGPALWLPR